MVWVLAGLPDRLALEGARDLVDEAAGHDRFADESVETRFLRLFDVLTFPARLCKSSYFDLRYLETSREIYSELGRMLKPL